MKLASKSSPHIPGQIADPKRDGSSAFQNSIDPALQHRLEIQSIARAVDIGAHRDACPDQQVADRSRSGASRAADYDRMAENRGEAKSVSHSLTDTAAQHHGSSKTQLRVCSSRLIGVQPSLRFGYWQDHSRYLRRFRSRPAFSLAPAHGS